MPDAIFADPRLARLYDPLDPDRSDLDAYVAMAAEFGARSVLDIGCGTGELACMLASRGHRVVAVDPAAASIDVARSKPGADRVEWLVGGATSLPPLTVDLAVMTGNVAQVFVTDADWGAALRGARTALGSHGRLVFETRDPSRRAWAQWTRDRSFERSEVVLDGEPLVVEYWVDLTAVDLPLVSFRWTFRFPATGELLTSDSTLRFRERDELVASISEAGMAVLDVRDAPDRPGLEWVFVTGPP